ncbi:hypothetical protein ACFWY6_38625 [Streptomyces sp. NPDC059037]|uniref:hypothetical protein n=1 Tax=Streptomyces sp. NPDC059037 TaxID=3346710 RepID=UPI0036A19023
MSHAQPRGPRLPAWTATLTWKAALFIAVMCCALAALLGALVHVSVTNQTVGQARERALDRLEDVTEAYEAGDRLGPGAGVDPARRAPPGGEGAVGGGGGPHGGPPLTRPR